MTRDEELELARHLTENHQHDEAYKIVDKWLKANPNDVRWLTLMVYIMLDGRAHV